MKDSLILQMKLLFTCLT